MTHVRKPLIALALSAAFALPMAHAQQTPPIDPAQPTPPVAADAPTPQTLTWADLDVNGDGKLSKEEAAPVTVLAQSFDAADADKDGLLTQEEYQAHVANAERDPAGGH